MKYTLESVTWKSELWESDDPVRPDLDASFKTQPGREVLGLKGEDGSWNAFMCYARTFLVPKDIKELKELTNPHGNIVVPYTVWSYRKGAGRAIINEVLQLIKDINMNVDRVVTLSPVTEMAEKFHLRNGATVFRRNAETINFEYSLQEA